MKRSTQVLLTLMLPAVAAFGCETAKKPTVAKRSNCSSPAKPGEPPKGEVCDDSDFALTQTGASTSTGHSSTHTARTGSYFPWIWFWGAGSRSYNGNAGVHSAPTSTAGPMTNRNPNSVGLSPVSRPAGAPSSVTSGGFGRTGGAFSGGS